LARVDKGTIYAIVGLVNINGKNFLCVVTDAEAVGNIFKSNVYKVTGVKLHAFDKDYKPPANDAVIENFIEFLKDGFYFSYGYDLTASRQRRIEFLRNQ